MYRIVASDMDETLIDYQRRTHPANFEAARLMREAGVRLVVATGRPFYSVEADLAHLGTLGDAGEFTITLNGGLVVRNDGQAIACHALAADDAQTLFDIGDAEGLCIHVYMRERTYVANIDSPERAFLAERLLVEDLPTRRLADLGEPVLKVLYTSDDFPRLLELGEAMARREPDLMGRVELSFSSERYLELNPKGVDKGRGLAAIAAVLGVPMAETIALGDSANDLPMLRAAGLGLVVANVSASIRDELADERILEASCEGAPLMEVWERYVAPSLGA